jgi:N-acetylmuramoyl-L-alanine amidase
MVVLHYTAMQSAQAAIDRLCDPQYEVSAHYVISEVGEITQLVNEDMRAWHAGAGHWGAVDDVNSHSIGIELANSGSLDAFPPFTAPQMDQLEQLLSGILKRWSIDPARVIGHSDMAPARKQDPGPKFDWQRFAQLSLSIWPEFSTSTDCYSKFESAAYEFGYRAPLDGNGWHDVLCAFRMRFRPGFSGPLDGTDVGLIENLAAQWPCKSVSFPDT